MQPNTPPERIFDANNVCPHCKYYLLNSVQASKIHPYNICNKCEIMAIREPQRFGKVAQSFGDFGELRKQKKAPHTEVFYIPVKAVNEKEKRAGKEYILRSVNNSSNDQITDHIRKVGQNLEAGNISQPNAEIVLDWCYMELNKRLNP